MYLGKEYTFTVPSAQYENRAIFEKVLLRVAGGYTAHQVQGGWNNKGHCTKESMTRYIVAMRGDNADRFARMLASWLRKVFKQNCIYVSFPDSHAETID